MSYTVIFTPESEAQLTELYRYIAAASSPEGAARVSELDVWEPHWLWANQKTGGRDTHFTYTITHYA